MSFYELGHIPRYDLPGWIEKTPELLDEPLLIITRDMMLPGGRRADLLAVDKSAALVIVEFRNDNLAASSDWQSVVSAGNCADISFDGLLAIYHAYLEKQGGKDEIDARIALENFLDVPIEQLNHRQRLLVIAKSFHADLLASALWLNEHGVDVQCVRAELLTDEHKNAYCRFERLIPLCDCDEFFQRQEVLIQKERLAQASGIVAGQGGQGGHNVGSLVAKLNALSSPWQTSDHVGKTEKTATINSTAPDADDASLSASLLSDDELSSAYEYSLQTPDVSTTLLGILDLLSQESGRYERENMRAALSGEAGIDTGQLDNILDALESLVQVKNQSAVNTDSVLAFAAPDTTDKSADSEPTLVMEGNYQDLLKNVLGRY